MPSTQTLTEASVDDVTAPEASSLPPQIILIVTVSVFFVLTWGFWILMHGNPPDRAPGTKGFREPADAHPDEPDLDPSSTREPGP